MEIFVCGCCPCSAINVIVESETLVYVGGCSSCSDLEGVILVSIIHIVFLNIVLYLINGIVVLGTLHVGAVLAVQSIWYTRIGNFVEGAVLAVQYLEVF